VPVAALTSASFGRGPSGDPGKSAEAMSVEQLEELVEWLWGGVAG